jgi:hypothetical protein
MQHVRRVEKHAHCNPYEGSDVFVVVRNPFERVLSEYYYNCLVSKLAKCQRKKINDASYMNEAIQKRLKWKMKSCQSSLERCYFANCNHDISQYDYVFDSTTTTTTAAAAATRTDRREQPRRVVRWVLHLERIQDEFADLMRRYGLQDVVRLPKRRINAGDSPMATAAAKNNRLTVSNFTPATTEWITKVYAKDFDAFGYSKEVVLPKELE